jgi:hypothetical protein
MKHIVALVILLGCSCLCVGQSTYPAPGSAGTARVAYCTPPTLTSRWYTWYQGNNCASATAACTDGQNLWTIKDTIGGNTSSHTGGVAPFSANQINALGAWNNNPSIGSFILGTSVPTSATAQSWYFVGAPTMAGFTNNLIGGSSGGALRWYILSSGKQVVAGSAGTVTGSATLTSGAWTALYFTYSSGTVQLYKCSAGTCSADGSSGTVTAPTLATGLLFSGNGGGYIGIVAEIGYYAGTSISGIGSYLHCQYPTI